MAEEKTEKEIAQNKKFEDIVQKRLAEFYKHVAEDVMDHNAKELPIVPDRFKFHIDWEIYFAIDGDRGDTKSLKWKRAMFAQTVESDAQKEKKDGVTQETTETKSG